MSETNRHTEAATRAASWEAPDDHITTQLGAWVTYDDRGAIARTIVRPPMWGEGSTRPRLSVFASIADALGGQTPEPSRFPTIDLRARLVASPPPSGAIEFVGRPLRVGRRFVVTEITMHDQHSQVFGRATVTLVNNLSPGHSPRAPFEPDEVVPSLDRLLRARPIDENSLELHLTDQIINGGIDTPFGGAQAWFAELAVEHLVGEPLAAVDLDIRFLQPMRVGPLRSRARRVGPAEDLATYQVDIVDVGAEGALVSTVTLVARPLEDDELAEPRT